MAHSEKEEGGCCDTFATATGLCCFMSEDSYKHNPLTEVVQNDGRTCTDLPCCFILLFAIIAEIALAIYAATNGAEPRLLMHGYDSRITSNSSSAVPTICDDGLYTIWPDLYYTDIRVCQSSCSSTFDSNNDIIVGTKYPSTTFMDSYCLPDYTYPNISSLDLPSSFVSSAESYQRAISDLSTAAYLILIMSFVAILVSYVYLKIIGCVGRMLIIFTIFVVLVGGVSLCWLLISDGQQRMKDEETERYGRAEFISGFVVCVMFVCVVNVYVFMMVFRHNIVGGVGVFHFGVVLYAKEY